MVYVRHARTCRAIGRFDRSLAGRDAATIDRFYATNFAELMPAEGATP